MKLWNDFKYALRLLKKNPGFSILSLIVVTFGMAICIFTFTLMYESNFRAPPFPNGDRFAVLKLISEGEINQRNPTLNTYTFEIFKEQTRHFDELGVFKTELAVVNDGDSTRQYFAGSIQPSLINMTQEKPILGRSLLASDALPGANPVTLLGYDVWQNFFTGNPNIVGKNILINGTSTTIVGVMPKDFQIALPYQMWLPLQLPAAATIEEPNFFRVVGVLKTGSSFAEAENEINKLLANMATQDPRYYDGLSAQVQPIGQIDSSDPGSKFSMPIICFLIMLLTAINLSSLLFVRANTRQRELAVRSAIGASKWEIIKQVLLESFILCLVGALMAVAIAELVLQNVEFDSPIDVLGKSWRDFTIHLNGLVASLVLMLGVWLTSSLSTSFRIARQDINQALEGGAGRGTSRATNVATKTAIGIEVIVAFMLLIVCGTFIASITDLYSTHYGASSTNIVKGDIALRGNSYQQQNQRLNFITNFTAEVERQQLVNDVAITTAVPGARARQHTFSFVDRELSVEEALPKQGVVWTSANYFSMMDVNILSGRSFTHSDTQNSQAVAIVDEIFANRYWPNENPIGKQIQINPDTQPELLTIIGVNQHIVQNVPFGDLINTSTLYRPITQATPSDFSFVVNANHDQSLALIEQNIRASSLNVDRDVAITALYELSYAQEAQLIAMNSLGKILVFIGISVLALSMIGIYGIISRSIVLRASEIGIRRAMGSNVDQIVAIFVKQGGIYIALGVVVGAGLALLSLPVFSNVSENAARHAPFIFTVVLVFLSGLIFLASYLPTRNILALEPGDALREE